MNPLTVPNKTTPFEVIHSGRISERVPRISGYQYYALPFTMDPEVDWATVLAGIDPRATLLSVHPDTDESGAANEKAGMVYPTDVTNETDRKQFIGILIDGHNFEQDMNPTVVLQGAVELKYIQSTPDKPWGEIDPVVAENLEAMGITRIRNAVYWDATRRALSKVQ